MCFISGYNIHLLTDNESLFDVKRELLPVTDRWKDIGLALRLDYSQLNQIQKDNRDSRDCLTEMLHLWLTRTYDTERFGEPSWRLLVEAVKDPAGGNDPALAKKIAGKYGGTDSLSVY